MSENANKETAAVERPVVGFVPLHMHSEYSFRDGARKVKAMVKRCAELGFPAAALTDHGAMHGVYAFVDACKENGIKPIIGVEAYVIPTEEMAKCDDSTVKHTKYHMVLLAKDLIGYHQIIKAVTRSNKLKDKKTYPRMTYALMQELFVGGHVVALSACVQGELSQLLLRDEYEEAKAKALFYQSIFGKGNYYIEVQNHGIDLELEVLPQLIQISRETGIPLVATNDSHYAVKEDAETRDKLVAMRWNQKVTDPDFVRDCGELYIKSYDEMMQLFSDVPEAISNTVTIAEMCGFEFKKEKHFPIFPKVPHGMTEDGYLRHLAEEGIYTRFPDFDTWTDKWKAVVRNRMYEELGVIAKLSYSGYLLIVQDFCKEGRRIGMVGMGRGSAVGSLVCYLTGITDVNPLKYDLLFERFLNTDRVSDPDIDTDFCELRDEVIKYVQKLYGENSVCNIVTFGTLGAKAAIRQIGRVTGRSSELCDRVAKAIPNKPGITIDAALLENPDLKKEYDTKREVQSLIDEAKKVEGLIVQTGVHAAGVIIADRDISEYVPLSYDEDENLWICQFEKKTVEKQCGLLKMDFLGLKNLTIIKRTIADIERNYGKSMTIYDIPMDDKEVIKEIFAKGRTKAVFQFESSGMVKMLKRFQPVSLEDLILLNAAFRPGPLQYLDEIIEVRHGRKKPSYLVAAMEAIMGVTYGKPIYQEQIQQIFNKVAGFSLGVADIIRRAMAGKHLDELLPYLEPFKAQLVKAGAKPEAVEKFSEELMEFSKYAFNKSHATAYAVLAMLTAWLKFRFPVEYMANVLTVAGTKDLPIYVQECKDMNIPVLPPSVNESGRYFTPTKNKTIRFGLAGVKNVGKACEDILVDRDQNGPYTSFQNFIERQAARGSRAVYKQVMEALIMTGAFDEFGMSRRSMMEGFGEIVDALKDLAKKKANPKSRAKTLEAAEKRVADFQFDASLGEFDRRSILEQEKDLMGMYASGHPLDEYVAVIKAKADTKIGDIDEFSDGNYVTLVGQIRDYMPLFRKSDGAGMGKFTLEDMTGSVNSICFTKTFAQYGHLIQESSIVILKGKVMVEIERDEETGEITNSDIQVSVSEIEPVVSDQKVYLRIDSMRDWEMTKALLSKHAGRHPLYVYIADEERVVKAKNLLVNGSTDLVTEIDAAFGLGRVAVL